MGDSVDFLDLGIYDPVDRMEGKLKKVTNSMFFPFDLS